MMQKGTYFKNVCYFPLHKHLHTYTPAYKVLPYAYKVFDKTNTILWYTIALTYMTCALPSSVPCVYQRLIESKAIAKSIKSIKSTSIIGT